MAYQKYMFDLDFGPPPANRPKPAEQAEDVFEVEPEPDLPPPPTFTEEDLQVVREAAYEEGHRNGTAEANETQQALLAASLDRVSNALAMLDAAQADANDLNQRIAARVAMAVLKKVLPAACEQNAFEEVVRTVQECLTHVLDEPRIIVRVDSSLVDPLRERLEHTAIEHGFEGRVVVQADPRVAIGDCRVEWTDGGAERDQVRLIADIETAVNRALALPEGRPEE
ncbi:FliH/SctL family protein [Paramagnetospirillum magneticum]|uniref:FlbE protein n=1 Tax=Paramagnetospirillum magneticum (strain ATCC 700264 / AMB-1) TaxID=342108 RepID=Q2WA20_PARM1|nr:FliH/SctL family protein [Paramagnetospirillum magneticum]BAE49305.1 FlbE protein [Paramagnetospirillum magneticum AMB-1]